MTGKKKKKPTSQAPPWDSSCLTRPPPTQTQPFFTAVTVTCSFGHSTGVLENRFQWGDMLATERERRSEGNFQVTEFAQETLPPTEQLEAHSPSFPLLQRCFLCSLLLLLHILAEAAGIFYSPLQPQIHSWGKVLGFTKQAELPWVFSAHSPQAFSQDSPW